MAATAFGIIGGAPMRARYGRERHLVPPRQLLAFDPSAMHAGSSVDGQAWYARLIVVEVGDLAMLLADPAVPRANRPAPYAFQIAHRIRLARRLLEAGHPIASVAANTGFADQSRLHRQFHRSLGVTPLTYQRRVLG
jgi:AraC-like DNA-binding protein